MKVHTSMKILTGVFIVGVCLAGLYVIFHEQSNQQMPQSSRCCLDVYKAIWNYEAEVQRVYNVTVRCDTFIPSDCNCTNVMVSCHKIDDATL